MCNKKTSQIIWWNERKCVPLQPQIRKQGAVHADILEKWGANEGSVAQLNRASDYGSEGCGFESRRNHKNKKKAIRKFTFR